MKRDVLPTSEGLAALAQLVVSQLQERGISIVFLNREGNVEAIPPGELELDSLPVEQALQTLLARGYPDQELEAYLRGREDRTRVS